MFYQAPTRHWGNDSYIYWVYQFCTICTQAVYPFPRFWSVQGFVFWRKGKTRRLCICLQFQTSHAACVVQKLFFQCWSILFLELAFQSVVVVSPSFSLFHCSLGQRTISSTPLYKFKSRGSTDQEGLQRMSSLYHLKNCYCGEKMIQATKWWLLVLRDVAKAFWLIPSVP